MAEIDPNQLVENRTCPTQDERRPSLYASIRLARFVSRVKDRLKSRTQLYLLGHRTQDSDHVASGSRKTWRASFSRASNVVGSRGIEWPASQIEVSQKPRLRLDVPS